jgi:hypothetical protein
VEKEFRWGGSVVVEQMLSPLGKEAVGDSEGKRIYRSRQNR